MRELSVFIDESGDFGEYDYRSPWYIVTMVFHDQQVSIQEPMDHLEKELALLGLKNHCIHTGPIIRKEEEYSHMSYQERRKIFNKMVTIFYFHAFLPRVEFRRVTPSEYRLFQVADMVCTFELLKLKIENNGFSKSERIFFGSVNDLKRNYLKIVSRQEIDY